MLIQLTIIMKYQFPEMNSNLKRELSLYTGCPAILCGGPVKKYIGGEKKPPPPRSFVRI